MRTEKDDEKIPLKLAKISIDKFNNQFIPQHVQLLNNHCNNIEKLLKTNSNNNNNNEGVHMTQLKKEEINANRILKQLKNHLLELNLLRNKIEQKDYVKFDELTQIGKECAINEIKKYLDLQKKVLTIRQKQQQQQQQQQQSQDIENDNDTNELIKLKSDKQQIQIEDIKTDFQLYDHKLREQQALNNEFENLYKEISEIHELHHTLNEIVHDQSEHINVIENNVEEVHHNVEQGSSNLRQALSYKKAMYPLCGAIIGTCIGGPVGLLVGLKVGGLTAVGCGILGFTSGKVMKNKEAESESVPPDPTPPTETATIANG